MKKKSLKRCLKKRMILLLGFLMMTGVAVAQQLQVQGKVTDATGEGLIGASVLVKGTTSGVITDIDGNYVLLNVNPDAILIFFFFFYAFIKSILGFIFSHGDTAKQQKSWDGIQYMVIGLILCLVFLFVFPILFKKARVE